MWKSSRVSAGGLIGKRAKRASHASRKARPFGRLRAGCFARLAQIPFGFAQGRLSLREERLLGMTRRGGFPLEWKCARIELIGGSGTWSADDYAAGQSACDPREKVWLAEPAAVLSDSRSINLALHAGLRTDCLAGRIVRPERTPPALVFARLVVVHHENDLVAGEG